MKSGLTEVELEHRDAAHGHEQLVPVPEKSYPALVHVHEDAHGLVVAEEPVVVVVEAPV